MRLKYPAITYHLGKDGSGIINNAIRAGMVDSIIQQRIENLKKELFPLTRNNNSTVYRRDLISDKYAYNFYQYFKGQVIERPEFLNVFQATKNSYAANIIISTAANSNCVDLRPHFLPVCSYDNSDKVELESHGIFLPKTNFKIIDVEVLNNDYGGKDVIVNMEETKESSVFTFTEENMLKHECMKDIIKPRTVLESLSEKGLL